MPFMRELTKYIAFLRPNDGKIYGQINLYFNDHELRLFFLDPIDNLPPNSYDAANRVGNAYQPFSQYPHYLDLIRNEKPILVTFRPEDTPPKFVVYCNFEPPGEGEIY